MNNKFSIFIAFQDLLDPRKDRNRVYSLFDLIAVGILGILCGVDDWTAIHLWTTCNLDWLQKAEIYLRGAPSHDTLSRFFVCVHGGDERKRLE